MKLLFVTQKLDADDPVLGFVGDWVRTLAERGSTVTVVANEVGRVPPDLGARVISLGKERGAGRLVRGARYERTVAAEIRDRSTDVLLAHMCPVYLNLAAPVVRARGVRSILWFAHPSVTASLRAADRLTEAVVTSLPGAYPLPGPKVRIIGQGTDVRALAFSEPSRRGPLRLIGVGRTSPSKGFPTIIRAVSAVRAEGVDARLRLLGPSTTDEERRHRVELLRLLREHLGDAGSLGDGVPHDQVAAEIAGSDVLVSDMVAGSGDKVVFEAAALGRLVVVSNPSFSEMLADLPMHLRFDPGDHRGLADRIRMLDAADDQVWVSTARELRLRVERDHSLYHWAESVTAVAEGRT